MATNMHNKACASQPKGGAQLYCDCQVEVATSLLPVRIPTDTEMLHWLLSTGRTISDYDGDGSVREFQTRTEIVAAMRTEQSEKEKE